MRRIILHAIALLFLMMATSGCKQTQMLLLDRNPCLPPCWFTITPQKTAASDIEYLLKSIPGVQFENKQDNKYAGFDAYYWNNSDAIDYLGSVYSHNGLVSFIEIDFLDNQAPLKTFMNKFGFPKRVLVFEQSAEYRYGYAYLIYPDNGIVIDTGQLKIEKEQIDLTPGLSIQSIWFYNPDSITELISGGPLGRFEISDIERSYQSWKGYGFYPIKSGE